MMNQYPQISTKVPRATAGFTLIEALVAITVLLLSIVGPMAIAQTGMQSSIYAKDQIVAFYIAQEGVEIIRSIRDENALNRSPWLTGIPLGTGGADCASAVGCGIDIKNLNFIDCAASSNTACNIFYDEDGLSNGAGNPRGIYSHDSSGSQTAYSRSIRITSVSATEVVVEAHVSWQSRGATRDIVVQSRLFDQYNNL